jgi:hypothetical protein
MLDPLPQISYPKLVARQHLKNDVIWDVMLYDSWKNRRLGVTYRFYNEGEKNQRATNSVSSKFLTGITDDTFQKMTFFIVTAVKSANLT